jgi:hypothetical protein
MAGRKTTKKAPQAKAKTTTAKPIKPVAKASDKKLSQIDAAIQVLAKAAFKRIFKSVSLYWKQVSPR